MLGGLFGFNKRESSPIPKNHIEVVCPTCGAAQYEPRLVVSTFCKRCGVHLRIEKKKVIASEVSKAGGQPDTLSSMPSRHDSASTGADRLRVAAPGPGATTGPLRSGTLTPVPSASSPSRRPVAPAPVAPEIELPLIEDGDPGMMGLGAMLQAATAAPSLPVKQSQPEDDELEPAESPSQAYEPSPAPAPVPDEASPTVASMLASENTGPMNAGTFQKMKDQGFYRQQYFKDAQCFDCDHRFKVARSSRSANCPNCGAYIGMEDIELNMPSSQAIKTRGDVLIRKRGQVTASHLYCRELRCFGLVSANMFCSSDAIFRASGTIVGELRCRRFVVEKGSELTFMNTIFADEAEIQAPITGNVICRGPLLITATGAVNGDVTARSVSIEPGGELNGAMNIVRANPPTPVPASSGS